MAEFQAKVYQLVIEEHPNADVLELARVGDYRSIVRKGQFKTGDLGVYIPEQAICPQWLVERLGLEGKLSGKAKNRVKAIKLRGVLSQGLIYPVDFNTHITLGGILDDIGDDVTDKTETTIDVKVGDDLTAELGIVKYEPVVPSSMSGEVEGFASTIKYDIENIKKHPDVLVPGELVSITEKLHGTWACFGYHPDAPYVVTSKGLSSRGLIFKATQENADKNLYMRTLNETTDEDGMNIIDRGMAIIYLPFYILGEIFGRGVQDLHYGLNSPSLRIFDVYVGEPGQGRYLGHDELTKFAQMVDVQLVPYLAVVEYSREIVEEFTNGEETVSRASAAFEAGGMHMREGVVVKPVIEREDEELGRVILKSVSENYLLRRGGTEFN